MNIACSSCPAKYAVPDDKVRGRKVKITCKRCGAAIIVDGTAIAPTGVPTSERKRQSTIVGGLEAPANSAPGAPPGAATAQARPAGVVVPKPAEGARAPGGMARAGAAPRPAAAPAPAPEPPWTVAITDDDHREMTTQQVVEAYVAGTIDAETFVWRDGMDDWLTPFEVPAIGAALRAKGLTPASDAPVPEAPRSQQSGWREPGRWDDGQQPRSGDVTFDDVTVAMEAPKAQALLDEAATAPPAPAPAPDAPGFDDCESTVVADSSRFAGDDTAAAAPPAAVRPAQRPAAGAPAPARPDDQVAAPAASPETPAPRAARSATRSSSPDLFAERADDEPPPRARMPSVPPEPGAAPGALTGARNESSVLFSLDQLAGKARPQAAKPRPAEKVDEAALLMGMTAPAASAGDDAPPSVARIGDGTLFGAQAVTMAAPDFTAPPAPSAPSHPPAAPVSAAPPQAPAKSSTGLWAAIVAVALGGGAAAFFLLRAPAATPDAATSGVAAEPPPPAPAPPPVEPAAATAPEPAPSAAPSAEPAPAPSAAPAATAETTPTAANPAPTTPPNTAAPTPAAGTPAATAPSLPAPPKPQPKPEATPAPAEGPPFDKGAAAEALAGVAARAQAECAGQEGTRGGGKVTVTFVNSGRATNALVSGDFAGSALGGCVARVFRSARVPAFSGDAVRVTKSVRIP